MVQAGWASSLSRSEATVLGATTVLIGTEPLKGHVGEFCDIILFPRNIFRSLEIYFVPSKYISFPRKPRNMEVEEPTNFGHRNNINPNGGTTSRKASALTCHFWAIVVLCTSAR